MSDTIPIAGASSGEPRPAPVENTSAESRPFLSARPRVSGPSPESVRSAWPGAPTPGPVPEGAVPSPSGDEPEAVPEPAPLVAASPDETTPPAAEIPLAVQTPLAGDFPPAEEMPVAVPAVPKTPFRAGEVKKDGIDRSCHTRFPNVTLPGPSDGVSVPLVLEGVSPEEVLPDEKDFDVARVKIADGVVTVFPKVAGDHELPVGIQTKGGKMFVTTFLLTVNPDPKTLWKDNPVPEGTPFAKGNRAAFHLDDGKIRILGASQRGRSHAQQGTCRDDDMAFWSDPATGRYVLAVADGAGSAKFSREGSRIAVATAIRELSEKMTEAVWNSEGLDFNSEGNVGQTLVNAAYASLMAIDGFVKARKADAEFGHPDLLLKDFNTTLLLAALKRLPDGSLRGATFSIGDGAIAWWQPGTTRLLCAPDGGEFSGQTKFLTTLSVWKEGYDVLRKARCFTFHKSAEDLRSGRLFLMSDGVSDPFFETDNMLKSPAEWNKFQSGQMEPLHLFEKTGGAAAEAAAGRLLDWLGFWSVGNHDDRTIAVMGASPEPPPAMPSLPPENGNGSKSGLWGHLFGSRK